jgi:hypothetical protein
MEQAGQRFAIDQHPPGMIRARFGIFIAWEFVF